MKVCIDMRPALSAPTGVGNYLLNLVVSMAVEDQKNDFFLFSGSWKERHPELRYGGNFHLCDVRIPVRLLNFCWNRLSFPAVETFLGSSVDLIHSPTPLLIPSREARQITTIYDLHFYFRPEHSVREIRSDYPTLLKNHSERSDAIITTSEHTKQLLTRELNLSPDKIHCIYPGVDPFFLDKATASEVETVRLKFAKGAPYYLFVGAREPRKNLVTLLKAFRGISENRRLVLVGPEGWGSEEWKEHVTDRVILSAYVSKSELRALYRGAIALVMPSLEEGFGFPLLEAMASGTSVVASEIPVFREVAGDAFLSFPPGDVEKLSARMNEVVENPDLRAQLIDRGVAQAGKYSWRQTAVKTLALYRSLVS